MQSSMPVASLPGCVMLLVPPAGCPASSDIPTIRLQSCPTSTAWLPSPLAQDSYVSARYSRFSSVPSSTLSPIHSSPRHQRVKMALPKRIIKETERLMAEP